MAPNGSKMLGSRLGLGTAQFGLDYGISNRDGITHENEIARILDRASQAGITLLDTAALYGDSEQALGRALGNRHCFRIVTKTPKCNGELVTEADCLRFKESFDISLGFLRQDSVYGLLVHQATDLFKPGGDSLVNLMQQLKVEGVVNKIGVSVYTGNQIDQILRLFTPDIIQLPLNILDQHLVRGGYLQKLHGLGVEIHCRSIFLQGLLLMPAADIDPYFSPWFEHLSRWQSELTHKNIEPIAAALGYALSQQEIDTILVGVCNVDNLNGILRAISCEDLSSLDFYRWALEDTDLLDPSRWRLRDKSTEAAR